MAEARRTARAELADHAMMLAIAADDTADGNARDVEGARDMRRMAAAYRATASVLDPATYPSPRRAARVPDGTISLVTPDGTPIEELTDA